MERDEYHQGINQSYESWLKRNRWISYGALAAMAYYLLAEHREHVTSYLSYLIFAACPLMYIFMHGEHGRYQNKDKRKPMEKNKS